RERERVASSVGTRPMSRRRARLFPRQLGTLTRCTSGAEDFGTRAGWVLRGSARSTQEELMRLGKYWQLGFGMALSVSVIAILSSVALAQDEEGGEEEMTFEAEGTPTAAPEPPPDNKPPTKTLERAIKLYDKKDYYSASIELGKVLN